ncbi:MAG: hypothetical protein LBR88_01290 [Zoogloeaceae bacterium]|nr:hypothetical protein [Zoogloeaceae bacterium]
MATHAFFWMAFLPKRLAMTKFPPLWIDPTFYCSEAISKKPRRSTPRGWLHLLLTMRYPQTVFFIVMQTKFAHFCRNMSLSLPQSNG